MKKIIATLILFTVILNTQSNELFGQSVFQHAYGDTLSDEAYCVYLTTDGDYLSAGYSNSFNSNDDVYLFKTNNNGALIWSKSIDILGNDKGYSVIEDKDTAIYYAVTGDTKVSSDDTSQSTDVFLMFNKKNGNPYYIKTFGDTNYSEHARCIIKTYDDAYLIVGNTDNVCASCGSKDIFLIKTDLTGNLIWSENIDIQSGDDYGMKLLVDSNKYIITGYTWQNNRKTDAFLIETDINGNINWAHLYGDTAKDYSFSVVKADSGYTLAGHTYSYDTNTDPDVFVVNTDLSGVVVWKAKYDSNRNRHDNYARDLIYYQGFYYLTGYADILTSSFYDLSLIKLKSNGLMQWQRGYGDSLTERGYSIINRSNRLIMAGYTKSFGRGLSDAYLVKTDLNGAIDCYNYLPDTNTTYLDSTYETPSTSVENKYDERSVHYSWVSPTSNDSICYFDTIAHDTTRYENINIKSKKNNIIIYPNPIQAGSIVKIAINGSGQDKLEIEIYDLLGNAVMNRIAVLNTGQNKYSLHIPPVSNGIYLLRLTSDSFNEIVKLSICR